MKFYYSVLCALALCGAVACSDDSFEWGNDPDVGYLSFSMATPDKVENVTRAEGDGSSELKISDIAGDGYTAPTPEDFTIVINKWDTFNSEEGEEVYNGLLSGWSATTPLNSGEYVVTAKYAVTPTEGESDRVGFAKPVFESDEAVKFTIVGGQQQTVQIPVSLKNAIVRLQFTEMFNNYYSYEKFTLTSTQLAKSVDIAKDDTRAAFIEVGEFTLTSTLTSQAQSMEKDEEGEDTGNLVNKVINMSKSYTAQAGRCHTITLDASNIGGMGQIKITFDDQPAETIDLGDIELNEDAKEENENN